MILTTSILKGEVSSMDRYIGIFLMTRELWEGKYKELLEEATGDSITDSLPDEFIVWVKEEIDGGYELLYLDEEDWSLSDTVDFLNTLNRNPSSALVRMTKNRWQQIVKDINIKWIEGQDADKFDPFEDNEDDEVYIGKRCGKLQYTEYEEEFERFLKTVIADFLNNSEKDKTSTVSTDSTDKAKAEDEDKTDFTININATLIIKYVKDGE